MKPSEAEFQRYKRSYRVKINVVSEVENLLKKGGFEKPIFTIGAFAARKRGKSGNVVCWGVHDYGGDYEKVKKKLRKGVTKIVACGRAFGAVRCRETTEKEVVYSVVFWGGPQIAPLEFDGYNDVFDVGDG
eukprot:UN34156